ncbi:hypothetical protein EJ02DRAFT_159074 [Clathrospora elynae]|uniref:Fe2OG dioxygenase domain-containing protein n=1 Tax=Clathrospora elynae TaxID=706981 RepID=A0A6A5S4N6_9PLEO|nr:hypothetical protein EJ02DRAFT_159074 [Clathrospora elynae]
MAENDVTEAISHALSQFLKHPTYACGGTIKIKDDVTAQSSQAINATAGIAQPALASPVTIRWDSSHSIEKITLPLQSNDSEQADESIAKLVHGTRPASFGYQGNVNIDESYRKASKLDTSAFSTNFCPYEAGIIDVIGQALLPQHSNQFHGIRAELYKLNVYQAPYGLFEPHVDIPRSDLQLGSLVVCLPCVHEGGQLVVRHQGHATTFSWTGSTKDIQWAAFYSDCEYQFLEVTSGHRITLTYNLFVRRGLGELAGHAEALDVHQLPLYQEVKAAIANPAFMVEGGDLGKYCSHAYAHATNEGIKALPAILKGSDMIAYEVFRSLSIQTYVRPVLNVQDHWYHLEDEYLALDHVGNQLSAPMMSEVGGCGEGLEEIFDNFDHKSINVKWLNEPKKGTENMQLGCLYLNVRLFSILPQS